MTLAVLRPVLSTVFPQAVWHGLKAMILEHNCKSSAHIGGSAKPLLEWANTARCRHGGTLHMAMTQIIQPPVLGRVTAFA